MKATTTIDTADLRRRVRHTIDEARRRAAAHRAAADLAGSRFDAFAADVAAPVFRQLANALRAEGHPFQVFSPAGSLRLASDRSGDDYVELALDTSRDPVALLVRTSHARGRHVIADERVAFEGPDLDRLTADEVLDVVLQALPPLVAR